MSNRKSFLLGVISGGVLQVISMATNLASIPISLKYWGDERFSIVSIMNSIVVYLSISNLGLNTAATILMSKNNVERHKMAIFMKSLKLMSVSIIVSALGFFLLNLWTHKWIMVIGKVPDVMFNETYRSVVIVAIFFFLNSILSLLDSALVSFHKLHIAKWFDALGGVLSFVALLIVVQYKQGMIHFFVWIGAFRTLTFLLKGIYFYFYVRPDIGSDDENIEDARLNVILSTGLHSLGIGIAAMIVFNTDNLVISHILGVASVASYVVTYKVFFVGITFLILFSSTVMPLFAKAIGNDDWGWIDRVHGAAIFSMATFGGAIWLLGMVLAKWAILLWTGKSGYAGDGVAFGLGCYTYLLSVVIINAGLAQSFNYTKDVLWIGWVEAVVKLGISAAACMYIGVAGAAIGTVAGSLAGPFLLIPWVIRRNTQRKITMDQRAVYRHFAIILLPCLFAVTALTFFVDGTPRMIGGMMIFVGYSLASYRMAPAMLKAYFQTTTSKVLRMMS